MPIPLLVKAGSGLLTFGNPSSAGGVPAAVAADTIVLQYNNPQQLAETFAAHGPQIAASSSNRWPGNMNLVKPTGEFLQAMRQLCDPAWSIADFRRSDDRFPRRLGVRARPVRHQAGSTTLGKTVGGGMPLAAFGGRADVMNKIARWGGISGRHIVRQPGGGGCRAGDIAVAAPTRFLRGALTASTGSMVEGLVPGCRRNRPDICCAIGWRHVRCVFRRQLSTNV